MSWINEIDENNATRKLKTLYGRIINRTFFEKTALF